MLSINEVAAGQVIPPTRKRVLRVAHVTDVPMQPLVAAAKGFEKCLHYIQGLADEPDLIINGEDAIMEAHDWSQDNVRRQWKLYQSVLKSENALPVLMPA